jgi:hypothetical protein
VHVQWSLQLVAASNCNTDCFVVVGSEDLSVIDVLFSVVKDSISLSAMTGCDRRSVLLLASSFPFVVDLWVSVSGMVS